MRHAILACLATVTLVLPLQALAPQYPVAAQAPPCCDEEQQVKTCLCSDQCVCGCNEGQPCDCARPTTPAKNTTTRQWYDLGEKLPPGEYRLVGGRYFRMGEPPATISYVQPQQYAIPTQRFSGITYGGSCGPGGCR